MEDYYKLLDVDRDADQEQIKKAYRKLALRYHPDRNEGSSKAEERFKEVSEAYKVLSNPELRARYDRHGREGIRGSTQGFPGGIDLNDAIREFMQNFGGMGGLDALFGGGRPRSRNRPERGKSLRLKLELELAEVRTGARREVRVAVLDSCDACSGSGVEGGGPPSVCSNCQGTGNERVVQRSMFGQFVSVTPCRRCRGEGTIVDRHCKTCRGEGRVRADRNIEVEIPAGVSSENYITLKGEGNAGPRGGPRGDVMVLLEVKDDPRFERRGTDLATDIAVTFGQAALGDRITVPTVEGSATVEIPPGTQSGASIRVAGEGLPELHGRRLGDLVVRVGVWVPTRLSEEQRRILLEWRAAEDPAPDAVDPGRRRGFWSRVKEAWG